MVFCLYLSKEKINEFEFGLGGFEIFGKMVLIRVA